MQKGERWYWRKMWSMDDLTIIQILIDFEISKLNLVSLVNKKTKTRQWQSKINSFFSSQSFFRFRVKKWSKNQLELKTGSVFRNWFISSKASLSSLKFIKMLKTWFLEENVNFLLKTKIWQENLWNLLVACSESFNYVFNVNINQFFCISVFLMCIGK